MTKKSYTKPVLLAPGIHSIGVKKTITSPKATLPREEIRGADLDYVVVDEASPLAVEKHTLRDPADERMARAMTAAAIASNSTVRTVSHILQNGTRMAAHPHVNFAAHYGLLIKLYNATQKGDEAEFLALLQSYLEQATEKIPGAGRKEDVPVMIALLQLLIGEYAEDDGFTQVANYLLRVANAPVDRF